MATVFAVVVLGIVVAVICRLVVIVAETKKRCRMNYLMDRLREEGLKRNLCFSGQDIVNNCVFGLDGVNRKLLVIADTHQRKNDVILVDLTEVKSCSVKKRYGMIKGGDLKRTSLENFLELMVFHFAFIGQRQPIEVVLFNHKTDPVNGLPEWEQKAKRWEMILSKLLHVPVKKMSA
jgi:hypothetical protein